ncbi:MAG: peroxiredoxin [Candidatus Micrarchaeia archaeon]
MVLGIDEKCPVFSCDSYNIGKITTASSGDYKGKWLVVFFYPRDFTIVCPTEIMELAKAQERFSKNGAEIIAISTDSAYTHKTWIERDLPMVKFPLLADHQGTISRAFGVYNEGENAAYRGTFIIDPYGFVKFSYVSNFDVGRSIREIYRTLRALQAGGLCPSEWTPKQKTAGPATVHVAPADSGIKKARQ